MPSVRNICVRPAHTAVCVLLLTGALALPVHAQGRPGVKIEYRGSVPVTAPVSQPSAPARPVQTVQMANAAPADRTTARIDFRYPDSAVAATPAPASNPAPAQVRPAQPVVQESSLQPLPPQAGQGPRVLAPQQNAAPATTPAPAPAPTMAPTSAPAPSASAPQGEFVETGLAILYGDEFAGLPTANGEIFKQSEMTAAHPALPLPSLVHVTNLDTGREVVVRVNDRGPFEEGAQLQLSKQAGTALGMNGAGRGNVSIRYLGPAPVLAPQAGNRAAPQPAREPTQPQPETPVSFAAQPAAPQDELLGGGGTAALASAPAAAPRVMSLQTTPAASASPARAPQVQTAGTAGDHFVQLASFSELGNAEAMYRAVEGRMPAEITTARVNGADFFRVRVGPFPDRSAAELARARLYADGTADGRVVSGR